jgi:two-component sensor histidine kinase
MQVISSLLSLQSAKIEDKKYADIFKKSRDRIKSMALIHEILYQSKDFSNFDFNGYVKTVVNYLFRIYGVDPEKMRLKREIEVLPLAFDHAIPCGLIINELVSNSLKYAFPNTSEGEIKIALRSINDYEVELTVSDNGVGMPEEVEPDKTESMGLQLIHILAENQLEGTLALNREGGTAFSIRFKG